MTTRLLHILLKATLASCLITELLFAGGGPVQPEAAQFEPVDAKDMVNLYTGDFTYSVPLLEVPGPEGGWPIGMSYHAGIGPNTEATWVGLGWTLNPGSINRFVNGYPDDMYAGQMETEFNIDPIRGWGVGIGVSYGPVGMSINYDSRSGLGVNTTIGLMEAIRFIDPTSTLGYIGKFGSYDVNVQIGTSGVGLSASLGLQVASEDRKIGASLGLSVGISSSQSPHAGLSGGAFISDGKGDGHRQFSNSMSLMGVNWSTQGGGASFSVAGTGFQNTAQMEGSGHLNSSSFSISIPIIGVPGLGISLSYYEWEWWLHEVHYETAFGTLQQLGYRGELLSDIWAGYGDEYSDAYKFFNDFEKERFPADWSGIGDDPPDVFYSTKMERNLVSSVLFGSEDSYLVNAQGLTGSFRPYFDHAYQLFDSDPDHTGKFELWNNEKNKGKNLTFRFDGDAGGNFASRSSDTRWESVASIRPESGTDPVQQRGARIVKPVIDLGTGKLVGFRITAEDGKTYEFFKPVYNYFYESVTTGTANGSTSTYRYTQRTPYVTSWYLTGVKGPDYIDMGVAGFSCDDFGYWVQFKYGEQVQVQTYRSPFSGAQSVSGNPSAQVYSRGARVVVYLESIETATHIARFETTDRSDDKNAQFERPLSVRMNVVFWTPSRAIAWLRDMSGDIFEGMSASVQGGEITANYRCGSDEPTRVTRPFSSGDVENLQISEDGTVLFDICHNFPVNCLQQGTKDAYADINFSMGNSSTKKLNRLNVYSKSSQSEVVQGIGFDSDYLLMPNSPNSSSVDGRKLTLKSIQKLGRGGVAALPATYFTYNSKDVTGHEVDWIADNLVDKYSNWNGYTSAGCSAFHYSSSDPTKANNDAGMWNLSSIYTPLGSRINIEYEADNIRSVGVIRLTKGANDDPDSVSDGGHRVKAISIADATQTKKTVYKYSEGNTPCLPSDYQHAGTRGGDWVVRIDWSTTFPRLGANVDISIDLGEYSNQGFQPNHSYNYDDIAGGLSGPTCHFDLPVNSLPVDKNIAIQLRRTGGNDNDIEFRVYAILATGQDQSLSPYATIPPISAAWTGDHTKLNNGGYIYAKGDPTGGILMIFPRRFSDNLVENSILSNGFNTLGPGPSVGYGHVEVMEVDPSTDQPLNGKIVHEFFTSQDPDWQFGVQQWMSGSYPLINEPGEDPIGSATSEDLNAYSQIETWLNKRFQVQIVEYQVSWGPGGEYHHPPRTIASVSSVDVTGQRIYFDHPVPFHDEQGGGGPPEGTRYDYKVEQPDGKLTICDNSGIYGRMKSITTYGQKGTSPIVFYPLQKSEFTYKSSSQLSTDNGIGVFERGNMYSSTPKLGLTQQKYLSQNIGAQWNYIDHQHENIFMVGVTNTNWFYNEEGVETGTQVTEMKNIGYDAYTGNVIMSVNRNAKNEQVISEQVPAYWVDPYKTPMQDKNMLTQLAETRGYIVPDGVDFLQLREQQKFPYLTSASVTTWKDWAPTGFSNVWRQDDSYQWIGPRTTYTPFVWTGPTALVDDDGSAVPTNDLVFGRTWKRTSNITQYDRYGHPIEERGLDNQFTSSLYGHGDALPIALASNAKASEIGFTSLETDNDGWEGDTQRLTTTQSHAGLRSYNCSESYGPTKNFYYRADGSGIDKTKSYVLEAWVHRTGGTGKIYIETRNASGQGIGGVFTDLNEQNTKLYMWQHVFVTLPAPAMSAFEDGYYLRVWCGFPGSGNAGFVDDVRFYPADASMSTYTYDPVTWKLTSITDKNNITAYFEYDEAGRLVVVRDRDRNVVKRHVYQYGKLPNP